MPTAAENVLHSLQGDEIVKECVINVKPLNLRGYLDYKHMPLMIYGLTYAPVVLQSPQAPGPGAVSFLTNHGADLPPSPVAYNRNRYNIQVEHKATQVGARYYSPVDTTVVCCCCDLMKGSKIILLAQVVPGPV